VGHVQISCVDANLIWVGPERRDMGGYACPSEGTLGRNVYF
jgi:hypothetical protein